MAYLGRPMAEAEIVRQYMGADQHGFSDKINDFVPDMATEPKRFMELRDQALESKYGRRFADQYIQNKLLGQGGTGSVFEKPGDPSRVLKDKD